MRQNRIRREINNKHSCLGGNKAVSVLYANFGAACRPELPLKVRVSAGNDRFRVKVP